MIAFVDTSAFYAVLDRDDKNHRAAGAAWEHLLRNNAVLLTTNYVLVETNSLLQNRLGMDSLRVFQEQIAPPVSVEWISRAQHEAAVLAVLTAGRRKLSLVDCVSFAVMREAGIRNAFAFDSHFVEQGFECKF